MFYVFCVICSLFCCCGAPVSFLIYWGRVPRPAPRWIFSAFRCKLFNSGFDDSCCKSKSPHALASWIHQNKTSLVRLGFYNRAHFKYCTVSIKMDYLSIILIIPSESSSAKIFLVESSSSLPRGQWFWWVGLCYYTAGQKLSLFLHQFLNLSQVSNGFWSSRPFKLKG